SVRWSRTIVARSGRPARRRRGTSRRGRRAALSLVLSGLDVPSEFFAHGRENFFGKSVGLTRAKASIKGRRQHVDRNRLFDRRQDRPASLAGVVDVSGVAVERRILGQRVGGEIEKPRPDHAAPSPHFGDVGNRKLIARFFRKLVGTGVAKDVEPLGV